MQSPVLPVRKGQFRTVTVIAEAQLLMWQTDWMSLILIFRVIHSISLELQLQYQKHYRAPNVNKDGCSGLEVAFRSLTRVTATVVLVLGHFGPLPVKPCEEKPGFGTCLVLILDPLLEELLLKIHCADAFNWNPS